MSDDDLTVSARVTIPERELSWRASRASGPGGQNVNKVATKVELRFDLGASAALTAQEKTRLRNLASKRLDADGKLCVVSQATPSQLFNLHDAREKLAALVRQALVPPKPRRATRPSLAAKRRRLHGKRQVSEKKRLRGPVRSDD